MNDSDNTDVFHTSNIRNWRFIVIIHSQWPWNRIRDAGRVNLRHSVIISFPINHLPRKSPRDIRKMRFPPCRAKRARIRSFPDDKTDERALTVICLSTEVTPQLTIRDNSRCVCASCLRAYYTLTWPHEEELSVSTPTRLHSLTASAAVHLSRRVLLSPANHRRISSRLRPSHGIAKPVRIR